MSRRSKAEVEALVEHIREEVRRHRDQSCVPSSEPEAVLTGSSVVAAPTLPLVDDATSFCGTLLAQTDHLIDLAQNKTVVNELVPKLLRPFCRNQGGYNGTVLRTVKILRDANQVLADENARLREHAANQADWMNRLAQGVDQLQGRLRSLERQNDHDQLWLKKLQAYAEDQAAEIVEIRQEAKIQLLRAQSEVGRLAEQQKRTDLSLGRLDDRQTSDASFLKHQFWLQQRRVEAPSANCKNGHAEDLRPAGPAGWNGKELENVGMADEIDALYVTFENVFRGSRQDIKQRLEFYLTYLREAHPDLAGTTVLDLGCGRGEWLELLGEQGYRATGVDLNVCMIDECRARGLSAQVANALVHLASLPAESVDVVSAFHLIEHLPSNLLLRFFRECRRVLHPGGLAIFETPNPYNLIVGAAQFYDDHTHQRPLPPNSTRFLVEQAGFAKADILPIHPRDDVDKVHGDGTNPELVERFNELFYGPQDYAILAVTSL